jgi:short-subunit dehydrogenase
MATLNLNSRGKRGLITFTSSSAGFLPTPISALYGATKCFLTSFSCSVGAEVKEDGIDVLCIHPSPTQSNFYQNAQGISLLTVFQKTAVTPDTVAAEIFKAAGRCFVRDLGYFSVGTKLLLKIVDWNFMAELTPLFMKSNADFRMLKSGALSSSKSIGSKNVDCSKEE